MEQGSSRRARCAAAGCAAVMALAGCSTVEGWLGIGTPEYKKEAPKPVKLEVPPDLAPQAKDDHFTVPTASASAAAAAGNSAAGAAAGGIVAANAPAVNGIVGGQGILVAPTAANARIEREGPATWLALDPSRPITASRNSSPATTSSSPATTRRSA